MATFSLIILGDIFFNLLHIYMDPYIVIYSKYLCFYPQRLVPQPAVVKRRLPSGESIAQPEASEGQSLNQESAPTETPDMDTAQPTQNLENSDGKVI